MRQLQLVQLVRKVQVGIQRDDDGIGITLLDGAANRQRDGMLAAHHNRHSTTFCSPSPRRR